MSDGAAVQRGSSDEGRGCIRRWEGLHKGRGFIRGGEGLHKRRGVGSRQEEGLQCKCYGWVGFPGSDLV